jgi:hypothetical protein
MESELGKNFDISEVKSVLTDEFKKIFNYDSIDTIEDIRSEINFNQLVT